MPYVPMEGYFPKNQIPTNKICHTYLPTYLQTTQKRPKNDNEYATTKEILCLTRFNDHIYPLYLDRKLYLATIQLQAEKGLGKSFSAMLPFVEGLHSLGFLSDADYELYKRKYSIGLEEAANQPTKADIIRTERKENRNKQLNRHFKLILEQWDYLKTNKPKNLERFIVEASHYKNLKYAKQILEKAETEGLYNGELSVNV